MSAAVLHTFVVVAALASYTILTLAGVDGNPVFAFIGGQAVGGVAQALGRSRGLGS
jgi:hypothetical protein